MSFNPKHTLIAIVAALVLASAIIFALRETGSTAFPPKRSSAVPSSPGAAAPGETSPFTGLAGKPGPVLAVKIDNVRAARPQTGIGSADIVYMEQVEAGQSRLLAVFSSHLPKTVGPVRSARESDLKLLRQFGRPALAYSGAQSKLLPLIRSAPLYDLAQGRLPAAYFRSGDRAAPHNLYLKPDDALAAAPDASTAHDIGFRFGPAPDGGREMSQQTVRYSAASVSFTWSAGERRWLVSMDSTADSTTDSGRLKAATVVVQYVDIHPSQYHDKNGSISPYTETTGSGKALVLRDGKGYDARWERPAAQDGTTFTTPGGGRMNFARGPVWVVYAAR